MGLIYSLVFTELPSKTVPVTSLRFADLYPRRINDCKVDSTLLQRTHTTSCDLWVHAGCYICRYAILPVRLCGMVTNNSSHNTRFRCNFLVNPWTRISNAQQTFVRPTLVYCWVSVADGERTVNLPINKYLCYLIMGLRRLQTSTSTDVKF